MERNELQGTTYEIYRLLATPMRAEEITRAMPDKGKREVKAALDELCIQGLVMKNKKNRYAQSTHYGCLSGIFHASQRGFGFMLPGPDVEGEYEDGEKRDIFIPGNSTGGAWHGDRVLVRLKGFDRKGRQEGEVIKILERSGKELVGTLEQRGTHYFLHPSDAKFPDIEIGWKDTSDAVPGDLVMVSVTSYGDKVSMPQGTVTARLGESGTMAAAIAAVLHENGVADEFPPDVISEAEGIPQEVTDIRGRLDLRDKLIFTIDGDDAKDFDDAVSLEPLENGHYLLGVHIADVSNYVRPGSRLDEEAFKRGTSVYFPGYVVPMLPFALSNGICSLNPDVDRFTFSALMEMDKDGRRHNTRFAQSVIRSKARMTYKKSNLILAGDETLRNEYAFLTGTLEKMNALALTLHKRRVERGALELEIPEAQITVDEEGNPIGISCRERGESERLIEEFMLQANEAVAEFMCRRGDPTVYRIHENPDPDKLYVFAQFARPFGYRIDPGRADDTFQLQAVLRSSKNDPRQRILPMLLLRSLARAKYAADCIGHYGLKAKFYLHFTSPIRRYPDLVAHRMLRKALSGEEFTAADRETCVESASQSTAREIAADNCERDIDKLFIAAYMKQFIGQEFDAEVAGLQQFGVFVALENGCEGLIHIDLLEGDFYEYDERHMILQGKHTGKRYTIGMPLKVRLIAASELTGQVDFALAETDLSLLEYRERTAEARKKKTREPKNREVRRRTGHKRHRK